MTTKSVLDKQQKEQEEMIKYYEEEKQKQSEVKDDKSADVSNINKSG